MPNYQLDAPNIACNANVTASKEARLEIVTAFNRFFAQTYGIKPEWLDYSFSNSLGEDLAEEHALLRPIGVHIEVSDASGAPPELLKAASTHITDFANHKAARAFRTFQANNHGFSANTWEDLAYGLNKSFAKAGSDVHIDTTLMKSR